MGPYGVMFWDQLLGYFPKGTQHFPLIRGGVHWKQNAQLYQSFSTRWAQKIPTATSRAITTSETHLVSQGPPIVGPPCGKLPISLGILMGMVWE